MSLSVGQLKARNTAEAILLALLSFLFALIAILIFITYLNLNGFDIKMSVIYENTIAYIFKEPSSFLQILYYASPLTLTAISVAISFKAGLFNIGGQGQMMLGAVFSAIWAANLAPTFIMDRSWLLMPTTILFGFFGGALWGFIPGVLKAKTGAHEVISTIMFNLIAISFVTFLVGSQTYSPFVDKSSVDAYGQTEIINDNAKFDLIFPQDGKFNEWFGLYNGFLNYSTVFVIFVIIVCHILIFKTQFGYRLRAVGYSKEASEAAGINSDRLTIYALSLSGGIAGLAGSFYVMGTFPYRYITGFEGTVGFDGIAVSLIAQNSPIAIGLAAIFFGFLTQSKNQLDFKTDIPPDLIFALQALIILFAAAPLVARKVYTRMKIGAAIAQQGMQKNIITKEENDND
ncbi:MAG: ABC transporter permease [Candidatus Heimdallarchaeota archaeon]|nr:ABC transporter permease [Candidatus Heimdallarchaeota archaeon]